MNFKKVSAEEREKKELERLIKKTKLAISTDKPKSAKYYADKILKLLMFYNGNRDSIQALYNYEEIIKFANNFNNILNYVMETGIKNKKKTGDLSKKLIYLFVLLFSKEFSKKLLKHYSSFISENTKTPGSLTKTLVKQLIALSVFLEEFKEEINKKYIGIDSSVKEFSNKIEEAIFQFTCLVIKNTKFVDWNSYFITKGKTGVIKKDLVRLKIILGLLYIVAKKGGQFYIKPGRKDQYTSDYLKLALSILNDVKKSLEEEKVRYLYLSIQDVVSKEISSGKNIAELVSFSYKYEKLAEEVNVLLRSKDLEYKKQVFAPFITGEIVSKKMEEFFCNINIMRNMLGQDTLVALFDLLEEKQIYNEYYDYLTAALNKTIKNLSSKIEIILKEQCSDSEKIEKLNAIKDNKNVIELFSEFQSTEYSHYKKHFEIPIFVEWLGAQLLKDISLSLTFGKSVTLDREILKVIESAINQLNLKIETLDRIKFDNKDSLDGFMQQNENLCKELEKLKFNIAELAKEKEISKEEIKQLKEHVAIKDREEKENLEVLKGTFQVNEDRNKSAVQNEFIMRIIKIVDKINILMAQGGEVNCSFVKSLLDQELSIEGLETFGEIGQQVKFDEALYAPVELSRSEDYLEKPVIILEKGYRYKDGKLIKKAVVRPM